MLVPGSSFGPMNSFWITEVNCTGDEISMIACVQLITGYSSSCPTQDIGVVCSDCKNGFTCNIYNKFCYFKNMLVN